MFGMLKIYWQTVMETCICQFYISQVELHFKLQEKLHCVTGPLEMSNERRLLKKVSHYCLGLQKFIK